MRPQSPARHRRREQWAQAFIARYQPRLERVISRVRGIREHEVEDVLSEVWLTVVSNGHTLLGMPRRSRQAWLIRVALSKAKDVCKREGRRRERETRWVRAALDRLGHLGHLADPFVDAEREEVARAPLDAVRAAFGRLDRTQKRILVARCIRRMSLAETAARLGITPSAVRAGRRKACRRLRDAVRRELDGRCSGSGCGIERPGAKS